MHTTHLCRRSDTAYPSPHPLQCFWLFLIFYGMPSQLSAFKVPSQCDYLASVPGYCCYAGGSPPCIQPAGNWLASEFIGRQCAEAEPGWRHHTSCGSAQRLEASHTAHLNSQHPTIEARHCALAMCR